MQDKKIYALLNHERVVGKMCQQNRQGEELAAEIEVSDRYLRNLFKEDRNISVALLYNISKALAVPMTELLTCEAE